ncbi:MAG: ABC transporter substrate-binding protein [Flavobacteriaceae bacterium]|jgi:iron complex transport system substrate-binding protein|nr:ABC transporter substrate-binding protein [Flavobacteriaceae bacterium]
MKKIFLFLVFASVVFSCKKPSEAFLIRQNEYAKNFSIEITNNQQKVSSAGTTVYFPQDFHAERCIITGTSSSAYIDALGKINTIVGVCSSEYFYNPGIAEGIKNKTIQNVGNDAILNFEKILALKPDIIITSHNSNYEKVLDQLSQQGIKILYVEEYMEPHPLGKTEYLKLFGVLFQENQKADSLYTSIKKEYLSLKEKTQNSKVKPTVFTNVMYGDSWYMAGGKSFIATLFADAGADFLWKDNPDAGSVVLSWEEVFSKAQHADHWIGASNFNSRNELLNVNSHYNWFDAYKQGEVYAMNRRENQLKANDYYESGSIYADKVLADVIKIVHPEVIPDHEWVYLKKLQ